MTHLSPIENLFAVEVPMRAIEFRIWDNNRDVVYYETVERNESECHYIELPPGSYEILFTTKGCTEEQAAGVARWFELNGKMGWKNYQSEHVSFPFKTAAESLQSLLRANGLDESKNYLLIKK